VGLDEVADIAFERGDAAVDATREPFGPPRLVDVALPFLSLATVTIPLPPLGTLGIDPNFLIPLPAFVIQPTAGVGSVTITVPNIPSLAGISIYGQALLIQYPTQDRLTNVTADVMWL